MTTATPQYLIPPTNIFGVDPGPRMTAFCKLNGVAGFHMLGRKNVVLDHATLKNEELRKRIRREWVTQFDAASGWIVVEMITPQATMGASTIETANVVGAIVALATLFKMRVGTVARSKVLKHHGVKRGAKADSELRRAMIERFAADEDAALGTREHPGPLHGVANHQWSALAVALMAMDNPGAVEVPSWW